MFRCSILCGALLLLLAPASALAKKPDKAALPESSIDEPADEAADGPAAGARPFIERSLVLAPEQAGEFALQKANDYPGQPQSGVGLRYVHPDFPEVRLDLFVYPAGRLDRDTVVADAMTGLRASIEDAAKQGAYTDLVFGEETAFDLARVDREDGSLRPTASDARGDKAKKESTLAQLLGAVPESVEGRGRRLPMSLRFQGEAQNSLAFLFYRGLYLYKGRVSASPQHVTDENFQRLANLAMLALVPAVQVRSTGACHDRQLVVDVADDASTREFGQQLMETVARATSENCAETLDETVPEGYRALPLQFDAAMWN
jgi:hypothetical protein